jgi:hypothetical protein
MVHTRLSYRPWLIRDFFELEFYSLSSTLSVDNRHQETRSRHSDENFSAAFCLGSVTFPLRDAYCEF